MDTSAAFVTQSIIIMLISITVDSIAVVVYFDNVDSRPLSDGQVFLRILEIGDE